MREHRYLAAMVSFVREHVAEHLGANGRGLGPAVAHKLGDARFPFPSPLRSVCSASASISSHRAALPANARRACCGVQCERLSCAGTSKCGVVSLIHLVRTLCMWVKIAAMVRTLPGGFAIYAAGSRCSMRNWLRRSFAAKMRREDSACCARSLGRRVGMALSLLSDGTSDPSAYVRISCGSINLLYFFPAPNSSNNRFRQNPSNSFMFWGYAYAIDRARL